MNIELRLIDRGEAQEQLRQLMWRNPNKGATPEQLYEQLEPFIRAEFVAIAQEELQMMSDCLPDFERDPDIFNAYRYTQEVNYE